MSCRNIIAESKPLFFDNEIMIQARQAPALTVCDRDDVFDTNAELALEIDARLDREDHARLQDRVAF